MNQHYLTPSVLVSFDDPIALSFKACRHLEVKGSEAAIPCSLIPCLQTVNATRCCCCCCRDLSPSIKRLLGVDNLWCDTRTEQTAQKFVLWAGHVIQHRAAFEVGCALSHGTRRVVIYFLMMPRVKLATVSLSRDDSSHYNHDHMVAPGHA